MTENFRSILILKEISKTNTIAIKELLTQSNHLEDVINSLKDKDGSKDLEELLTSTEKELNVFIKKLFETHTVVEQTYGKLIDFANKKC